MGPSGATPPLSPAVRRHLGRNLQGHYAEALSEPVSERLEALIAQLDKPSR
ncbi:NepR family anti-sigma factor [Methylobacterium persicinum]